ncbi:galactose mutarotase-like [Amphibalanus amphitrite]|uniref:galactose mutarotase-like n=1 Tax=Amphibalanus amphitrite TaxID=1232801 RepID=UPI001C8FB4FA|nr:galactose mutarotase-like [Amphibalanus amphitrite]XP_043236399.1 galactose mutarotase-like [Amphibalanus amphitrite]XP_043236400.1 galactose mutarotase-like [Amphibalanus amphitrite]XP_043236401.1 galactose mutarotase-like [Amphibalanus amphitrite]XP_043236402.1 galactose mutarotase-like [Amphibalanus amphitrite]XP_043236403.1 galactose mutarotase-like [Amphibalanus amphitrite]XP_043236404.1 galactose mutarotase-like [Amphibalanus amphitrite]
MSAFSVQIERVPFGVLSENGFDAQVDKFQLTGTLPGRPQPALVAVVCPLGATLLSLLVPDEDGKMDDVTLGFDTLSEYQQQDSYIGATIGRVASRIAGNQFQLDNATYKLAGNSGGSHLHGGIRGFDKRLWSTDVGKDSVTFSYLSPHGEEGYPGDVMAQVTYRLVRHEGLAALSLQYRGLAGAATPLSMTNHAYFNLAGHESGEKGLLQHDITIRADKKLVLEGGLANGQMVNASGAPGGGWPQGALPDVMAANGGEIDDVFVLPTDGGLDMKTAATLTHAGSGRRLTVFTDQPALVVYTANHLPAAPGGLPGRGGARYQRHGSIALETSAFPNAVNVPSFPSVTLRPGNVYEHRCVYQFGIGAR